MGDVREITALVESRAELAGQIEATHEALRKMVMELENLHATIQQFDQVGGHPPQAFRPPKDWSNRGEMTRIVPSKLDHA